MLRTCKLLLIMSAVSSSSCAYPTSQAFLRCPSLSLKGGQADKSCTNGDEGFGLPSLLVEPEGFYSADEEPKAEIFHRENGEGSIHLSLCRRYQATYSNQWFYLPKRKRMPFVHPNLRRQTQSHVFFMRPSECCLLQITVNAFFLPLFAY